MRFEGIFRFEHGGLQPMGVRGVEKKGQWEEALCLLNAIFKFLGRVIGRPVANRVAFRGGPGANGRPGSVPRAGGRGGGGTRVTPNARNPEP